MCKICRDMGRMYVHSVVHGLAVQVESRGSYFSKLGAVLNTLDGIGSWGGSGRVGGGLENCSCDNEGKGV